LEKEEIKSFIKFDKVVLLLRQNPFNNSVENHKDLELKLYFKMINKMKKKEVETE